MNSWWYALEKEVPVSVCDAILSLYDNQQTHSGRIAENQKDVKIRNSSVIGFPYGTTNNDKINEILEKYIVMANSECFGFSLNGFREFQIAKYEENNHYKKHIDLRLEDRISTRKLSITLQLSSATDYEGGEFLFSSDIRTPRQSIIKQKGTLIIFPSFLYHQVTPVTKGSRYSLVGWYEGSNWN